MRCCLRLALSFRFFLIDLISDLLQSSKILNNSKLFSFDSIQTYKNNVHCTTLRLYLVRLGWFGAQLCNSRVLQRQIINLYLKMSDDASVTDAKFKLLELFSGLDETELDLIEQWICSKSYKKGECYVLRLVFSTNFLGECYTETYIYRS